MPHGSALTTIGAVGLATAFVLGALANRLRMSPLVGYLVAGIIVGPFTPGFVADQELANQLAEIGVMLLMFGVGLHFSLKDLMEVKAIAIPGAVAQITVATVLGWGLASLLGWPTLHGVVFGFALATASTVVLLRAMEERRLLDTTRGRIAVGWLIVEDLACVIALVMMPVMADIFVGDDGAPPPTLGAVATTVLWTMLKVAAFVAVMLVVGRRLIPLLLERIAGTGSRELFTLSVLAIALGIAFGSALLFGVSFAPGALFAGLLLNESELSHKAAHDSLPRRDALAAIAMLVVGRRLSPLLLERIAGTGWRELLPLSVLAIGLGIAFGSALLFGVSFALGAFFAGILLNESELSHKAANDSLPLRDAFAVLFFVSLGMLFDPMILVQRPLEVLATAFIILFGKSAAAYSIVRAFGHPSQTALTISASLAQIGEFAFIIAGLGVALGMLSGDEQSLVLAGALISIMLNPMIFRLLDRRLAKKAAADAATAAASVEAARREATAGDPPLDVDGHTIVVGYGRVGRQLALLLRDRGVPVVVVEE